MTTPTALMSLPVPPHHDDAARLFAALVRQAAAPCPAQAHAIGGRGDVARAISSLLKALDAGARRRLRLSPRGAHGVGADERALVNLVAAIQIGREEEARLRIDWLVGSTHRRALFTAAARLADALADEWIYLPVPATASAAVAGRAPVLSTALIEADPRHIRLT